MNEKIAYKDAETICRFHLNKQQRAKIEEGEEITVMFYTDYEREEYNRAEKATYYCGKITTSWNNNKLQYLELIFDKDHDENYGYENPLEMYEGDDLEDIISWLEDSMKDN